MTPKKKAEELLTRYMRFLPMNLLTRLDAKQCALIAVDEILTADMFMMTEEQEQFWEEVKTEIEKI